MLIMACSCVRTKPADIATSPSPSASTTKPFRSGQLSCDARGVSKSQGLRAERQDTGDDVLDGNGHAVRGRAGIDIRSVALSSDGIRLTLRMVMSSAIPADSGPGSFDPAARKDRLLWVLDTWRPKTSGTAGGVYQFRSRLVGTAWRSQLIAIDKPINILWPGEMIVAGSTMTMSICLSDVPELHPPFDWSARTESGYTSSAETVGYEAAGDSLPDGDYERAPFPDPASVSKS